MRAHVRSSPPPRSPNLLPPVQPTSPPPPLTHGEKYNLFVNGNIYLQRVLFGRSNFATNGEVLAVVDDDAVSLGVVTCVFGKF